MITEGESRLPSFGAGARRIGMTAAEKIGGGLFAIFGALVVTFVLLRIAPGDPARLTLGPLASAAAVRAQNARMGLDKPLYIQYERYISQFARGDWGFVYGAGNQLRSSSRRGCPRASSWCLRLHPGVCCSNRVRGCDNLPTAPICRCRCKNLGLHRLRHSAVLVRSRALYVFFLRLGLFPAPEGRLSTNLTPPPSATGFYTVDALLAGQLHVSSIRLALCVPAVTLSLVPYAYLVRLLRGNLLDVAREPYILVARSKGISELRAFTNHALHNAFFPTLTAAALLFAQLISGSVLVERIFNWPGVGALVVDSIQRQDFAIVQAVILLSAFAYVAINLMSRRLRAPRPRLRHGTR